MTYYQVFIESAEFKKKKLWLQNELKQTVQSMM